MLYIVIYMKLLATFVQKNFLDSIFSSSHVRGGGWKVFSCVSFSAVNALLKNLTQSFSIFQVSCLQNLLAGALLYYYIRPISLSELKRPAYIFRNTFAVIAIVLFGFSLQNIPLTHVVCMGFVGSIISALFGIFIFKEHVCIMRAVAILLGILGGILVGHGQHLEQLELNFSFEKSLLYILIPLGASLSFTIAGLLAKYLVYKDTPEQVAFYAMLTTGVVLLFTLPYWKMPSFYHLFLFISLALFTVAAHVGQNKAYVYSDVTFLMPFGAVRMIASAILGWFVFSELPSFWIVAGTFVIILAIFVLSRSLTTEKDKKLIQGELSKDAKVCPPTI